MTQGESNHASQTTYHKTNNKRGGE